MNDELKQIKKIYGEEMMHLCRELFPSILEREGLLLSILQSNLAPTHSFTDDIKEHNLYEEFKSWIYSFIDVEKDNQVITNKTPFELMDEAGYILYECKSEEDIQSFRKYYSSGEELCTFRGGRLNRCHVFFAVKKNVDDIKRENFISPKREDEYGTSVISIQFSRGKTNDLSIKNRYNHTVNNPDATFSNNLENIIPGLTKSFEKYYGLNINQQAKRESDFLTDELNYVKGNDKKYYRYNLEIYGIYYCENNIIVRYGEVITKYRDNSERYILIDQYILDIKEKKFYLFKDSSDAFVQSIIDVGEVRKIDVIKNGKNRVIKIYYDEEKTVQIEIDKHNNIIGYENNYVQKIGTSFLSANYQLSSISLPNVQKIGDVFLSYNKQLSSISLPNVQEIGDYFLFNNKQLSSISLPNVQKIGDYFLRYNEQLSSISLPNVQEIGGNFLSANYQLSSISLPNVQEIGDAFLFANKQLSSISLPNVQKIGGNYLNNNEQLSSISLPSVREIGDDFLFHSERLSSISLPNVQEIGGNFLYYNEQLSSILLPNVQKIGYNFLCNNEQLSSISLPNVQKIGDDFLFNNKQLSSISLPNVQKIGILFLRSNSLIDKEVIFQEMEVRNAKANNQRNK